MRITLTKKESEDYFYTAMCNGLAYIEGYDIKLTYDQDEYNKAKSVINDTKQECCYEDILMQMLRMGYSLTMVDIDNVCYFKITLKDVHKRVQKAPVWHLSDMYHETDDAYTADAILQVVFFNEIIFA